MECIVEGCSNKHLAKGLCNSHYQLQRRNGSPIRTREILKYTEGALCSITDCTSPPSSRGLCRAHYVKWRRDTKFAVRRGHCSQEGCLEPHYAEGLCERHRYAVNRYGVATEFARRPKGSGYVTKEGYRVVYVNRKPVFEHRHVMEGLLGRPLLPHENVHHRNGDRQDNSPANLELWSTSQPSGQRIEDKVAWALEILRTYGQESRIL